MIERKRLPSLKETVRLLCILVLLIFAFPRTLIAQSIEQSLLRQAPSVPGRPVTDQNERLQLANAASAYPVTPGDVYRISYVRNGEPVTFEVTVDIDYTINLNLFGQINVTGLTFANLKPRIRNTIEDAIPRSLPSVSMVSAGVFPVTLVGELPHTEDVTAWGMARLSDIVRDRLASYSSIRRVSVVSSTGRRTQYDLFRGIESGDRTQDPFVRPGDTVEIARAERVVHISGAVNRGGRFELRNDESFAELLRFARGTTREADRTRVRIIRNEPTDTQTIFVNLDELSPDASIVDGDMLIVPTRPVQQRIVYVEGPIDGEIVGTPRPVAPQPFRRTVSIGLGDTLHDVLVRLWADLPSDADLSRASLRRDGRTIATPSTFYELLYSYRPELDVELQPLDRIVIPVPLRVAPIDPEDDDEAEPGIAEPEEEEEESTVLVTGAVNAPGRYPLRSGMGAYTHIRYAGGFNRELNSGERYRVYDAEGNLKDNDAKIESGDHVEVLRNSFAYNFNRNFPIIATGIGFFATIVATLTLFGL